MSNQRNAQPAADLSLDVLRSYLSDNARRELDTLRTALDARLGALEDALAHPERQPSLEALVLDLARVATAEAESAATRAVLQAQLHAHERAAAVSAEALRLLETEREMTGRLRLELEQAERTLEAERERGVGLGRELGAARAVLEVERRDGAVRDGDLEQARADLQGERDAGVALGLGVEEARRALRSELESEQASKLALDTELAEQREAKIQLTEALAALQSELDAARRMADTRDAADEVRRLGIEGLERRNADLDRDRGAAMESAEAAGRERDVLAADLATARQAVSEARGAADARMEETVAERARTERAVAEAEARRGEAVRERDALTSDLDGARQAVGEARGAADARLEETVAERARTERAVTEAEARRGEAVRERDALAADLDAARRSLQEAQGAADARLEETVAERARTERAVTEADARREEAVRERDTLAAALEVARHDLRDAQAVASAQLGEVDADWARTAQTLIDAQASAGQAARERDALAEELHTARRIAQDTRAAVEARLEAIDAERTHNEQAWKYAEARAEEAIRERDALAAELDIARQAAGLDAQHHQRLEAADERIRTLELQLFERERGLQDRDVELEPLLDTPSPASEQPVRRSTRYGFSTPIEVHVDGHVGLLVDLSVGGAQVLCEREPDMDHVVTLLLQSDEVPVSCQGNVVWARSEPPSEGWPLTYRAGIAFTTADESAVETFIIRYSAN